MDRRRRCDHAGNSYGPREKEVISLLKYSEISILYVGIDFHRNKYYTFQNCYTL